MMAFEQTKPGFFRRLVGSVSGVIGRLVGRSSRRAASTEVGDRGSKRPAGQRSPDLGDEAGSGAGAAIALARKGADDLSLATEARTRRTAKAAPTARAERPALHGKPRTRPRRSQAGKALRSVETTVEGLRIHAVERPGGARAQTVILIHGAGLDHRDWTFGFIDRIAPRWRVLAFDRPGFGGSERPTVGGALPATQARLLRGAARQLGVERAVLVGHSWGGAVVTAWALDAPEQTTGVVSLAGAVMPWSLSTSVAHSRRARNAATAAFRPGGLRQAALDGVIESFSPEPVPAGYVPHIESRLGPLSGPAVAMAADVATISGALSMQKQRYPEFAPPIELVYGGQDAIVSVEEQAVALQALIPHARLNVVPDAGHMIHHTHPDRCLAAITRIARRS